MWSTAQYLNMALNKAPFVEKASLAEIFSTITDAGPHKDANFDVFSGGSNDTKLSTVPE